MLPAVSLDRAAPHQGRSAARAALFLAIASASLVGCKKGGQPSGTANAAPAPKLRVETAAVEAAPMPRLVDLSGSLLANEDSDVAAGVGGKVLATYVERGTIVKKGAPLAKLDARLAAAAAREASAQLDTIRAQREQAKADCSRAQQLFDKGAMTKVEFERAQTQCRTSEAQSAAAEARVVSTSTTLEDSTIRAPFSGMVVERAVSAGEYVRPDSKIATLVQIDPLRLELTVPEAQASLVRQGMQVTFRTAADAPEAPGHKAVIRYVGPAVRKQTRDLVVEAVIENADRSLRPGMFVSARLNLGEAPTPVIPREAARRDGNLVHAFVVTDKRIEDRLVQLGEERSGRLAVLEGLKPGEQVVAKATPELRDGLAVE
jgi:membrane fusion protein (multidrug efflux system)